MNILKSGTVTTPTGFRAAGIAAHIKYVDRLDLAVLVSDIECAAAGVFTQNQVAAAPVIIDKETLEIGNGRIRAIIANAGNANACTGQPGLNNARATQRFAAANLGCAPEQVLVLSTGVIGVQLPMDKMQAGIETAVNQLSSGNGTAVAQAIMTTDTHPKHLAVKVELPGGTVTIGGMAKGSGMIHPNMATLLGVLTTDALVAPERLDEMLKTAVNASFNRISIDGDTSTNDTVLLLANGASGVGLTDQLSIGRFEDGLTFLCQELAKMIVRDGEGATKFVEIQVTGAATADAAHTIASTIATSPLVKTAFAGSDANWGRILMAAGRAGVPFDQYLVGLWIGTTKTDALQLVNQGTPMDYLEVDAARIFSQPAFIIRLDLGMGAAADTVWTCDLSHDYVSINADYRT